MRDVPFVFTTQTGECSVAFVFERDTMVPIPAFPVEGPLDIVGAGDATTAGAILGLTLGLTLPEAVLLGGCVSSITIQQISVTGTATIEQVNRQLLDTCLFSEDG